MKKLVAILASLTLVLALLTACGGGTAPEASPTPAASPTATPTPASTPTPTAAPLSGTVSTNGSTSMEKVVASLIESFTAANTSVNITYDATGSGAGITAATEGTADIGLSSRALKSSETGLDATVIALDGIAIIVNNGNAVNDLTIEQIAALFTGEIDNWSAVGGANEPVAVIGREAGSGTRDGFESITATAENCVYDQELTSTGAVISAVASNPYAIGYASLSAVSAEVKSVTVNGVVCSEATVLDGTYAIQRPFVMVTKSGAALSAAAQAFLDYAAGADAADIIRGAGAVPVQ